MIQQLRGWVQRSIARLIGAATIPAGNVPIELPPTDVLPFDPNEMVVRHCLNGPCQGAEVHAPRNATPGTACALAWETVKGSPRYAVYVLVDWNGSQGLMFLKSYDRPEYAQAKVQKITAVCAGAVS